MWARCWWLMATMPTAAVMMRCCVVWLLLHRMQAWGEVRRMSDELTRSERMLLGALLDLSRLCLARAGALLRTLPDRARPAELDVLRADRVLHRVSERHVRPDALYDERGAK